MPVHTVFVILIFLISVSKSRSYDSFETKVNEAISHSKVTYNALHNMLQTCVDSHMASKQFKMDNIKSFINYPSRTTVGNAAKFTSNRKFLANVISTRAFKDMVNNDADEMLHDMITKMKFCDNIIMNQSILKDFYDREVDQTKL